MSCSLGRQLAFFFMWGGTGARALHVRSSPYASAGPKNFFLCVLCIIPKNDFVYPVDIPKDFLCVSAVDPRDCGSRNCTQGTKI